MTHRGRRFALGDLMRGFARAVGRTSGLSLASLASRLRYFGGTNRLANTLRELGPYTAIALILPGGSLIALAAWSFRHRPRGAAPLGRLFVVLAAFGIALVLPGNI